MGTDNQRPAPGTDLNFRLPLRSVCGAFQFSVYIVGSIHRLICDVYTLTGSWVMDVG